MPTRDWQVLHRWLCQHLMRNQSFWVPGGVWSQGWNLKELTEGHHQEKRKVFVVATIPFPENQHVWYLSLAREESKDVTQPALLVSLVLSSCTAKKMKNLILNLFRSSQWELLMRPWDHDFSDSGTTPQNIGRAWRQDVQIAGNSRLSRWY